MDWLNKYWPVLVGVVMCVIAFAETRVSVFHNADAIERAVEGNSKQWRKLNEHESRISRLEGRIE